MNWFLFKEFFVIGMTTFGGGSSVVPVAHQHLVEKKQVIKEEEFLEIVTVSNLLPGPSMVEIAGGIGYRLAGPIGAVISALSISLPAMILFVLCAVLLFDNIDPEIMDKIVLPTSIIFAGSMFVLSFNMGKSNGFSLPSLFGIILTTILIVVYDISPVLIMLVTIAGVVIKYMVKKWLFS